MTINSFSSNPKQVYLELREAINEITNNNNLFGKLMIEIINIFSDNPKKYIHTQLNTTPEETALLINYLKETIDFEKEVKRNSGQFCVYQTNLNYKLRKYINNLKYKEIIERKYRDLESLGLKPKEIKILKAQGITTIGKLIEYTPKELLELHGFSETTVRNILYTLEVKGIHLLEDIEAINNILINKKQTHMKK